MKPYYADAGITLYHGDCREVMPSLEYACVIMDPPYGLEFVSGQAYGCSWESKAIPGDGGVDLRDEVLRLAAGKPAAVFGTWKRARPTDTRAVLIWDKGPASGMGDLSFPWKLSFEEIYIIGDGWSGRRDEGVLRYVVCTRMSMGRTHPTEKPTKLLQALIAKAPSGTVLDPFCGTGASLVAAKNMGRRAIGVEIDERYCEIAANRLGQSVMFGGAA